MLFIVVRIYIFIVAIVILNRLTFFFYSTKITRQYTLFLMPNLIQQKKTYQTETRRYVYLREKTFVLYC